LLCWKKLLSDLSVFAEKGFDWLIYLYPTALRSLKNLPWFTLRTILIGPSQRYDCLVIKYTSLYFGLWKIITLNWVCFLKWC
jgi:hypothetical protein